MSESESKNGYSNLYRTIGNDHQSLAIKFNTQEVKRNIIFYLKGIGQKYVVNESGELETEYTEIAKPKLNDKGIQSVMMLVESLFNTQVVQGNFDDTQYNSIVGDFHETLFRDLAVNMKDYGLEARDYTMITRSITSMLRGFLTRPISDKERTHNSNVQVKETVMGNPSTETRRKKFLLF